jgi:DeoR/GlpR family transcriptional regulator of sugar metabolism
MLIYERHQKALEILRQRRAVQLDELARTLGVSSSTVRRDLEALEQRGLVQRTHGGAVYAGDQLAGSDPGPNAQLAVRMSERIEQKQAIARYAAEMVQPHMTLLLDGGSTVIYTAKLIQARPIQVVTNSLSIANAFANDDQVELLLIGGSLYPRSEVLVGPIALNCLGELHADLLFFSLAGIYGHTAFNINLAMAQVEQLMMRQAARRVMLMDAAKFGRKSLVGVCELDEVEALITDEAIDPAWKKNLGDRLVIAPA